MKYTFEDETQIKETDHFGILLSNILDQILSIYSVF